jgi:hypothetical protein
MIESPKKWAVETSLPPAKVDNRITKIELIETLVFNEPALLFPWIVRLAGMDSPAGEFHSHGREWPNVGDLYGQNTEELRCVRCTSL